jgi:hypothetical protein|tara:strand:- start:278 stop:493 length:216 start_codon:yes stop_codon:yes gene_type:complete
MAKQELKKAPLSAVIKQNDKKEVVKKKPKVKTEVFKLIKRVVIGDTQKEVGDSVRLTEKGKIYFQSKNYIK